MTLTISHFSNPWQNHKQKLWEKSNTTFS